MPRKPTGQVLERKRQRGRVYALRFRAYGERQYVTLGATEDGWTRKAAEEELQNVLADVRRGIWRPPAPDPEPEQRDPSFHEFSTAWYRGVELGLAERTQVDYTWRLSNHLLPYFARMRLSAITVEQVDRYRSAKERERLGLEQARAKNEQLPSAQRERLPKPLSNSSINKTIRLLATVLDQAVEYGLIDRNPAKGRKRLLGESTPTRSYLQPDQVAALLSAAGELDAEARHGDSGRRRPLLATLTLAGLRISEALDLHWANVSLGSRKLQVRQAKTDAGIREIDLSPLLAEQLGEYRTRTRHRGGDELVFPTAAGKRDNPSNIRNRFLASAVTKANEALAETGAEAIGHLTPHSLRRTFASLLLATGADVPYAMAQLGHTNPKMTLGVYARVIASSTDHGHALDGLLGGSEWAPLGTSAAEGAAAGLEGPAA